MTSKRAYLDCRAVAEMLGVPVTTVYNYRWSGRLPQPDAYFGRAPVWKPKTISAYIARLQPNARVHRSEAAS